MARVTAEIKLQAEHSLVLSINYIIHDETVFILWHIKCVPTHENVLEVPQIILCGHWVTSSGKIRKIQFLLQLSKYTRSCTSKDHKN